MLLAAVMAMVLAAAAPAFAQATAVGGSVQYVDCDQIQAAATGQYNTDNQQDVAGVAQELGVSQNQVLACLNSIAAGRDVNINTASLRLRRLGFDRGPLTGTARRLAAAPLRLRLAAAVAVAAASASAAAGGALPPTGGASLLALGAGALLVGGGLLARRIVR